MAHVILVSAPVPIGPFNLGLLWVWDLDWVWGGLGLGLGLDNIVQIFVPVHNIGQQIVVLQFIVHRHLLKVDSQSSSVDTSLLENEAFKHFSGKSGDREKEFLPFSQ